MLRQQMAIIEDAEDAEDAQEEGWVTVKEAVRISLWLSPDHLDNFLDLQPITALVVVIRRHRQQQLKLPESTKRKKN